MRESTKKNENNVISFENIEHHENYKTQYDNKKKTCENNRTTH